MANREFFFGSSPWKEEDKKGAYHCGGAFEHRGQQKRGADGDCEYWSPPRGTGECFCPHGTANGKSRKTKDQQEGSREDYGPRVERLLRCAGFHEVQRKNDRTNITCGEAASCCCRSVSIRKLKGISLSVPISAPRRPAAHGLRPATRAPAGVVVNVRGHRLSPGVISAGSALSPFPFHPTVDAVCHEQCSPSHKQCESEKPKRPTCGPRHWRENQPADDEGQTECFPERHIRLIRMT